MFKPKLVKVNVVVQENLYDYIIEKFPWLCFDGIEEFAQEAVTRRVEDLLQLKEN